MRRAQRIALALSVGGGAVVLGGASLLLAPRTDEQLSAALGAHDRQGLDRLASGATPKDAGTAILVARSLLDAGKPAAALTYLTPVAAAHPGDATVAALLERAYAATGRHAEQLAAARVRGQAGGVADVRAWRALAVAAGDEAEERAALARLDALKAIDGAEMERLAWLDERGGDPAAARARLAAQRDLSTEALQRLLRLSLTDADAPTLDALLARLGERHAPPGRAAVADDLDAKGRAGVALALVAAAPAGEAAGLWPRRFALLRKTGDAAGARALLAGSAATPGGVAPAELLRAAYAIDWPEGVLIAAEHGAMPRPDATLARDLANRMVARPDLIARLDRVAGPAWRRADPWLAFRVAQASGDRAQALRAAAALPGDAAEQAREQLLANDRPALRALLMARQPTPVVAERLLALGFRDDAMAVLRVVARDAGPEAPATRRLLYLMGPRPDAASVAWLRARADKGADRLRWLALYADRDRPAAALRTLEAHPLGDRTEMLLARLDLAAATCDAGATTRAGRALLDGRALTVDQLRTASAALPAKTDPALRMALTKRRIAAGAGGAGDRMEIAWTAWNGGDPATARVAVQQQLAASPDDADALMLMAAIDAKAGGEKRALPWVRRAYAAGSGDSRARAGMLRRMGRRGEALAMVRRLRAADGTDRGLIAEEANLLVATGRPGAAQALFAR